MPLRQEPTSQWVVPPWLSRSVAVNRALAATAVTATPGDVAPGLTARAWGCVGSATAAYTSDIRSPSPALTGILPCRGAGVGGPGHFIRVNYRGPAPRTYNRNHRAALSGTVRLLRRSPGCAARGSQAAAVNDPSRPGIVCRLRLHPHRVPPGGTPGPPPTHPGPPARSFRTRPTACRRPVGCSAARPGHVRARHRRQGRFVGDPGPPPAPHPRTRPRPGGAGHRPHHRRRRTRYPRPRPSRTQRPRPDQLAEAFRLLADLARAGWPADALALRLGVNARTVAEVRERRPRLRLDLALRIRRLHRELIGLDPISHGIRPADAARVRTAAARREMPVS